METLIWEMRTTTGHLIELASTTSSSLSLHGSASSQSGSSSLASNYTGTIFLQQARRHLRQLKQNLIHLQDVILPNLSISLSSSYGTEHQQQQQINEEACSGTLLELLWTLMERLPIPNEDDGRGLCLDILNRVSDCWVALDRILSVNTQHHNNSKWDQTILQRRLAKEYTAAQSTPTDLLWCARILNYLAMQSETPAASFSDDNKTMAHVPLILLQRLLRDCVDSLRSVAQELQQRDTENAKHTHDGNSSWVLSSDNVLPIDYHALVGNLLNQVAEASRFRPIACSEVQWLVWQLFPNAAVMPQQQNPAQFAMAEALWLLISQHATLVVEHTQDRLDAANWELSKLVEQDTPSESTQNTRVQVHQKSPQRDLDSKKLLGGQTERFSTANRTPRQSNSTKGKKPPPPQGNTTANPANTATKEKHAPLPPDATLQDRDNGVDIHQQQQQQNTADTIGTYVKPCLHWATIAASILNSLQDWSFCGMAMTAKDLWINLWRTCAISLSSLSNPVIKGNNVVYHSDDDTLAETSHVHLCHKWDCFLWSLTNLVLRSPSITLDLLRGETQTLIFVTLRLLPLAPRLTLEQGPNSLWDILKRLIGNGADHDHVKDARDLKHTVQIVLLDSQRDHGNQHRYEQDQWGDINYSVAGEDQTRTFWDSILPLALPSANSPNSTRSKESLTDPFDQLFLEEWNRMNRAVAVAPNAGSNSRVAAGRWGMRFSTDNTATTNSHNGGSEETEASFMLL